MGEQRKLNRRHIMFYSRVFDRKTGEFLGYIGNMTIGGAMVISDKPLEIDKVFSLRIDLPEDMYKKPVLNLEARSIWCQPDVDPTFYNTGFQLLNLTPDDAAIIGRIIDDFDLREN